jgi:molybdopterin-containing oxidoreductase family membrane subunit
MPTIKTSTASAASAALIASLAGGAIALAIVLVNLGSHGHAAFNTTSLGLMWGLPIVTYDYFVVTSTGLTLIACLSYTFGMRDFDPVARRCLWLAATTLAGGVVSLMLELGHPLRSLYAIPLNLQTASPLFWKMLFITAYGLLLLAALARGESRPGRGVAIALFVAALGVALLAGSVFGMMAMRPLWYGGEVPLAFLAEGLTGGFAFAILGTYLAYGGQAGMPEELKRLMTGVLPKLFALMIALTTTIVIARTVTGLWSNLDGLQVWDKIATSPLYHLHLWAGLVLPLALMLLPGQRSDGTMQITAALLVAVALFIGRYEFVIGGQLVPLFKGSWAPAFIDYAPSFTEWMLTLASLSIAAFLYTAGDKILNLGASPHGNG